MLSLPPADLKRVTLGLGAACGYHLLRNTLLGLEQGITLALPLSFGL